MEEQSSMKTLDLSNVTVYFSEKKKCLLYLFLQSWFHHVVSWAQDGTGRAQICILQCPLVYVFVLL